MTEKSFSSREKALKDAEFSLRIQNQSLILLLHAFANELPLAKGEEDITRIREEMLNEVHLFRHERAIFQKCLDNLLSSEESEAENIVRLPGAENREGRISERAIDLEQQSAILNNFVQRTLNQHFSPDLPQRPVRRDLALQDLEKKIITIYSAPESGSTE